MNSISEAINNCKEKGRTALIPYIVGGYPDEDSFKNIFRKVCEYADVLEVGIPFSDPLADGPIIQKATAHALSHGQNIERILELVAAAVREDDPPVVVMAYYNTVYKYGLTEFASLCSNSGISGVIIPDLPVEEASSWKDKARSSGLDTIFLVAPNSSKERQKLAADYSSGFVYCVSVTGVTGSRKEIPDNITQYLDRIRQVTDKPLALGFGISEPGQVRAVAGYCDAVIVGSALVDVIKPNLKIDQNLLSIDQFLGKLKQTVAI